MADAPPIDPAQAHELASHKHDRALVSCDWEPTGRWIVFGAEDSAVHRLAARMDDHYTFVAGALSSTPEKALRSGAALGLDPRRTYGSFEEMAARERRLKDGIEIAPGLKAKLKPIAADAGARWRLD